MPCRELFQAVGEVQFLHFTADYFKISQAFPDNKTHPAGDVPKMMVASFQTKVYLPMTPSFDLLIFHSFLGPRPEELFSCQKSLNSKSPTLEIPRSLPESHPQASQL
eukprot:s325_g13.t1